MALVGPSGVGKTTLCSLIPRFYDVSEGELLIDGVDVRDMKLNDLRNNVGIVQQDVYLFAGTIMENIRYGKSEATDEEVVLAAKNANAHEFIMSFPDGYDTDMGQMSARLSGGERQRIGIARVLLRDPDVCQMDEPSSALDALHEKELLHTLQTEYTGKTLILISHRSSTLTGCNRLLKMGEAEG